MKLLTASWALYGLIAILGMNAICLAQVPADTKNASHPSVSILDRLDEIEPLVLKAIENEKLPGAVVLIGFQGQIVYERAFGHRQLEPAPIPMATDTVFDLASLTKPIATATSIMMLVERGLIALNDPVAKHLPEFGSNGKQSVTVQQLLLHTGGLIPDNAMSDYQCDSEAIRNKLLHLSLNYEPGTKFRYSDVGFQILGELVREKTGKDITELAHQEIFGPLQMNETGYLPAPDLQQRCAATEQRDGQWMVGQVHDPRAFAMGGIAGHAGLFSTAQDVARYAQMILGKGSWKGTKILAPETVQSMIAPYEVPGGIRGLGWDKQTGFSINRGKTMSPAAVGHGGFTGTGLWIDPELDLFVVFLSNRLHPKGKGSVNDLIGQIGTLTSNAAHAELFDLARYTRACERPIYGDEFSVICHSKTVRSLPIGVFTHGGEGRYVQNGTFRKCTIVDKKTLEGKEIEGARQLAIQIETAVRIYHMEDAKWKLSDTVQDAAEVAVVFRGVQPVSAPYFVQGRRFSEVMSDENFRIHQRDVVEREGRPCIKIAWSNSHRYEDVDYSTTGSVILDIQNHYAIVESVEMEATSLVGRTVTTTTKIDYVEVAGRRVPIQIIIDKEWDNELRKSLERIAPIRFDFSPVDDDEFAAPKNE